MPFFTNQAPRHRGERAQFNVSTGTLLSTAFDQGVHDGAFSSISRLMEYQLEKTGRMLSIEEANDRYGVGDLVFDSPQLEGIARLKHERKKDEMHRGFILSQSKGFKQGAGVFASAMAGSMLNPIDMGSAFFPFVGSTKAAALLKAGGAGKFRVGLAGGLMTSHEALATRIPAARVMGAVIDGVASQAVVEIPLLADNVLSQSSYGPGHSAVNVLAAGIFSGGLRLGIDGAVKVFQKLRPSTKQQIFEKGMNDILDGRSVSEAEKFTHIDEGKIQEDILDAIDAEFARGNLHEDIPIPGPPGGRVRKPTTKKHPGFRINHLEDLGEFDPHLTREVAEQLADEELDRITEGIIAAFRDKTENISAKELALVTRTIRTFHLADEIAANQIYLNKVVQALERGESPSKVPIGLARPTFVRQVKHALKTNQIKKVKGPVDRPVLGEGTGTATKMESRGNVETNGFFDSWEFRRVHNEIIRRQLDKVPLEVGEDLLQQINATTAKIRRSLAKRVAEERNKRVEQIFKQEQAEHASRQKALNDLRHADDPDFVRSPAQVEKHTHEPTPASKEKAEIDEQNASTKQQLEDEVEDLRTQAQIIMEKAEAARAKADAPDKPRDEASKEAFMKEALAGRKTRNGTDLYTVWKKSLDVREGDKPIKPEDLARVQKALDRYDRGARASDESFELAKTEADRLLATAMELEQTIVGAQFRETQTNKRWVNAFQDDEYADDLDGLMDQHMLSRLDEELFEKWRQSVKGNYKYTPGEKVIIEAELRQFKHVNEQVHRTVKIEGDKIRKQEAGHSQETPTSAKMAKAYENMIACMRRKA